MNILHMRLLDKTYVGLFVCFVHKKDMSNHNQLRKCVGGVVERWQLIIVIDVNFFDDMPNRHIFHCDDCGMCRRGRREDFFHCNKCAACLAISMRADHACLEDVLKGDCPVCSENMFTSTTTSTFLRCGHAIHSTCLTTYFQAGYWNCPVCKKSIDDEQSQRIRNARIDQHLEQHRMPEEYKHIMASVLCNDCLKNTTLQWHFQYHKCSHCGSYNTDVVSKQIQPNERRESEDGAEMKANEDEGLDRR